mmetsp:Transcript_18229/g.31734  ORF Transcript_18229/g.31734 Transcript_18229/m.31734 type:complete len:104 (+) Transcript_18229:2-313(+)
MCSGTEESAQSVRGMLGKSSAEPSVIGLSLSSGWQCMNCTGMNEAGKNKCQTCYKQAPVAGGLGPPNPDIDRMDGTHDAESSPHPKADSGGTYEAHARDQETL